MDTLLEQVRIARRRLVWQQYLARLTWVLAGVLLAAAIAIGVGKWRPLPWDGTIWAWAWFGGAAAMGLLATGIWTWAARRSDLEAAIEVDRRFELKERVSSALALSEAERNTEAGAALTQDAIARVSKIDVADRFRASPSRKALIPVVPAAIALGLMLLPDAVDPEQAKAKQQQQVAARQIEQSSSQLTKKLADKRQEAEKQKLNDAAELFQKLEQGVQDAKKLETADRKQVVAKLNDLANELKQRRQQLSDLSKLRPPLQELKQVQQGPAEKLADALRNGNVNQALQELEKLQQALGDQKLNEAQRDKLAHQLQQMQDKLQKIADAHQRAKEQLEKQAEAARKSGDADKTQSLQQQLDKLARQDLDMDTLKKLADKLGACSSCVKQGNGDAAQRHMAQLADQLRQMQSQLAEAELLEQALDEIAKAKNSINCPSCNGEGCQQCQGDGLGQARGKGQGKSTGNAEEEGLSQGGRGQTHGQGEGQGKQFGDGLGRGRGAGERPENPNDARFYDTNVSGKVGPGKSVVIGEAQGPNLRGKVTQGLQMAQEAVQLREDNPQNNRRLPPGERDQAREYFDLLRGPKRP